jgi:hypothetical protein
MTETETHTDFDTDAAPLVYVREIAAAELKEEAAERDIELPDDAILYAVHTEDGVRRAVFSDRDAAFEAAVNHGAQPVSVH